MNRRVEAEVAIAVDASLISAGVGTLAAVLVAFLALDDITTDNAASFALEYRCLLGCAAWCLVVAAGLTGLGYRVLGTISQLVLAGALWGQRGIGPGTVPSWRPEYLATVGALVWFLALSVVLVVLGLEVGPAACGRSGTE